MDGFSMDATCEFLENPSHVTLKETREINGAPSGG